MAYTLLIVQCSLFACALLLLWIAVHSKPRSIVQKIIPAWSWSIKNITNNTYPLDAPYLPQIYASYDSSLFGPLNASKLVIVTFAHHTEFTYGIVD